MLDSDLPQADGVFIISVPVTFTLKRESFYPPILNVSEIPRTKAVKYLGIHMIKRQP